MRNSTNRRGGKAVPRSARAVWGGIGAGVLAAFLASPAPAAGLSPDWDRDTRNSSAVPAWGPVPAWIVAVAESKLPPLEPGNPQLAQLELVRLAEATVADQVLAEIRGGFISILGMEIDIGFDFRTFINGALVVHDVASPTAPGGGSLPSTSISTSSTVVTVVSTGDGITQVINDILSGGDFDGPDDDDIVPNVISPSADGSVIATTEITSTDGGVTTIINQINGVSVSTTVTNTANGLQLAQINTTTVSVLDTGQFFGQINSGGGLGGTRHLPLGLLTGLIGVIPR